MQKLEYGEGFLSFLVAVICSVQRKTKLKYTRASGYKAKETFELWSKVRMNDVDRDVLFSIKEAPCDRTKIVNVLNCFSIKSFDKVRWLNHWKQSLLL